ncbi:Hsp20 family protein [Bradyrhizobium jicamae]|uniref:Hsp20 family protein n=1 Tax=Bradyrhizobium jicamae TaxID=280332 RepID=UPI00390C9D06
MRVDAPKLNPPLRPALLGRLAPWQVPLSLLCTLQKKISTLLSSVKSLVSASGNGPGAGRNPSEGGDPQKPVIYPWIESKKSFRPLETFSGRPSASTACSIRRSRSACGRGKLSPYNIERLDENSFQISVALAGFKPDEVELTVEQNVLTLEDRKSDKEGKTFLHRGISARNFKRQFTLADHVEARGARFENGLLIIDLQREIPEAMKPRRFAIKGTAPSNVTQIESRAA